MTWLRSLLIALLTSIVGMVGAGVVASLAIDWYNISSFEGGAGFFVVGMALLGLMGSFVIGLVVSRVAATRVRARFGEALAASSGTVALILAVIAGASWMLADIPPRIDGEELFLLAEIRWPVSSAAAPSDPPGAAYLRLGALRGNVARKVENGPVFIEDARQEDGRWIVPGALPIFTSRGRRLLDFGTRDKSIAAFVVPLPGRPGERHRQWSEWLPPASSGQPPAANQFSYRFKVIKRSEPVRTERIGQFEVDTIADYFYYVGGDRLAARATFRIRYGGQPVPDISTADTVAPVGGPKGALFVTVEAREIDARCALLIPEDTAVRVERVSGCGTPLTPRQLTADRARFAAAAAHEPVPGWIDRSVFAEPGLFQLHAAVIDTRTFAATTVLFPEETLPNTSVPPLDLSPDERSFVWLVQAAEERVQLGVTDWRSNRSYTLPIDRTRMRFNTVSSFNPDWVRHHFEWRRGADGRDVLVERAYFVPLPHRGDLSLGKPGEYQSYTLQPGGEPLRDAIVEILVRDLAGEPLPDEPAGFRRVRVKGKELSVAVIGSPTYVNVSMDTDASDPEVMSAIGTALDAALASGRYDALFVR
jgi:hypothetical protein